VEVVASLSHGRTAAAQCGLSTHKSVPVIFEPPCIFRVDIIPTIFQNESMTLYKFMNSRLRQVA